MNLVKKTTNLFMITSHLEDIKEIMLVSREDKSLLM